MDKAHKVDLAGKKVVVVSQLGTPVVELGEVLLVCEEVYRTKCLELLMKKNKK